MKKCQIRICDDEWYWDMCSGNSDALCNEDSSDPYCSICELKMTCTYANFPADREMKSYTETINDRKNKRNTEICSNCAYNTIHGFVVNNNQELRKIKLTKLERELKFGKVKSIDFFNIRTR